MNIIIRNNIKHDTFVAMLFLVFVLVIVSLAFSGTVFAVGETQETTQTYDINAVELIASGSETETQRFIVFTNQDGVAYQHFTVTVYDPTISLEVVAPDKLHLMPGAVGNSEIAVRAYSGSTGYDLQYAWDDTKLVCQVDGSYLIPSVLGQGPLSGVSWGQNIVHDLDGDGMMDVPTDWLPINTSSHALVQTVLPSGFPYDEYNMMVGVLVGQATPACEYLGNVTFTLASSP